MIMEEVGSKEAFEESCKEFLLAYNPEMKPKSTKKINEEIIQDPKNLSISSILEKIRSFEYNIITLRREVEALVESRENPINQIEDADLLETIWNSEEMSQLRSDTEELIEELEIDEIISSFVEASIANVPKEAKVDLEKFKMGIETKVDEWIESLLQTV